MGFHWDNQVRRLQWIHEPIQTTLLKSVAKEMNQGKWGCLLLSISYGGIQLDRHRSSHQSIVLKDIDHHITLKQSTQPIYARPSRYAYFQKVEIKKNFRRCLIWESFDWHQLILISSAISKKKKKSLAYDYSVLTIEY